jgi:hypothetical protein
MEIFGGFMVMVSILGLFLAVVWLIMPFVVFAIKGKQDRSLEILEGIDRRLAMVEQQLEGLQPQFSAHVTAGAEAEDVDAQAPDKPPLESVLPLA